MSDVSGPLVETPAGFVVWVRTRARPRWLRGAPRRSSRRRPRGRPLIATYDLGLASGSTARERPRAVDRDGARGAGRARVQGAVSADALADLAADPSLVAVRSGRSWRTTRRAAASGCSTAPTTSPCGVETRPAAVSGRAPLVVHLQTARASAPRSRATSSRGPRPDAAVVRMGLADHVRALAGEIRLAEPDSRLVVLGDLDDGEASAPLAGWRAVSSDLHGRLPVERPYTSWRRASRSPPTTSWWTPRWPRAYRAARRARERGLGAPRPARARRRPRVPTTTRCSCA